MSGCPGTAAVGPVTLAVGCPVTTLTPLSVPVMLALAGFGVGALGVSVKHGAAASRRRIRTGPEGIIGHVGVVRSWTDASGSVSLDGALWRARRSVTDEPELDLHVGDAVVVERLSGLTLSVRRAEDWELM